MLKIISILLIFIIFSGCSTRFKNNPNTNMINKSLYKKISSKYKIDYKILHAICFTESSEDPFVINVNSKGKLKGTHRFKNKHSANSFIRKNLHTSNINYDIGFCQINSWWLLRLNITSYSLLNKEYNLNVAAKIFKDNLIRCKNNVLCALSIYNTGRKNSKIGKKYTALVLKNKRLLY